MNISKFKSVGLDRVMFTVDLTNPSEVLQTSNIQLVNNGITASKPMKLDADKKVVSGNIDLTSEVTGSLPYSNMNIADGDLVIAKVNGLQGALNAKESTANKNQNNGYAGLDEGGKIPVNLLPSSVMTLEGEWNATTNTPTLADGTGDAGMIYEVTVAGTVDFGNGDITFNVGDFVVYGKNNLWYKSINSNEVVTVNGQKGVVVLDSDDISEGSSNLYFTAERARTASVSNSAYDSSWDGVENIAPSKNAVYDQIQSMGGALVEDQIVDGVTTKAPSQNAVYDALAGKEPANANIQSHISSTSNPHSVTKAQVDLGNVDNTSDADKPVSTATQTALNGKQDLGQNKFTAVVGEAFEADRTFAVRWGTGAESANKLYKATSDHENAPNKYNAVGFIQTTGALVADDAVTCYQFISDLALASGDSVIGSANTDNGQTIYLNKDGTFSRDPAAGLIAGDQFAIVPLGQLKVYNTTVTSEKIFGNAVPGNFTLDIV